MSTFVRASLISALVAAFAASAGVQAQTTGPAGARASKPAARVEQRPFSRPTERVEAVLAYQRTALKISNAQQPQWDAYADFIRKRATEMEQRMSSARAAAQKQREAQRPGAIERLERQQSLHADAVRRLNERLAVQKPLYAALSPEQQKIADQVLSPRSAFGARRHAHGRHMMRGEGRFARG